MGDPIKEKLKKENKEETAQGRLEVLVCKEVVGWGRRLKDSKSVTEFFKNFPRVYHGAEVEVRNLRDEKDVYYLNTDWHGVGKARLPAGSYQVTVKEGNEPSKNISVLRGKKSRVYFSVKEEKDGKY